MVFDAFLAVQQLRSIDKERETKACSNLRACATQRPTQVRQGLLFVWGESGAAAEAESSATEAPLSTFREQNEGESGLPSSVGVQQSD